MDLHQDTIIQEAIHRRHRRHLTDHHQLSVASKAVQYNHRAPSHLRERLLLRRMQLIPKLHPNGPDKMKLKSKSLGQQNRVQVKKWTALIQDIGQTAALLLMFVRTW
jgi:hypothetical protein